MKLKVPHNLKHNQIIRKIFHSKKGEKPSNKILHNKFVVIFIFFVICIGIQYLLTFKTAELPSAASIAKQCKKYYIKNSCYFSHFRKLISTHTLSTLYPLLLDLQKVDHSLSYCHELGHKLAAIEVAKNPEKWIEVLKEVDIRACADGFFHGVLEQHISYSPNFELNNKSILNICNEIGEKTEDNKNLVWNSREICIHSLGHILLVQNQGNTNKAITICNTLPRGDLMKCKSGVFMELVEGENLSLHGFRKPLVWNLKQFVEMEHNCNSFKDNSTDACWAQLAKQFAQLVKGNPQLLYNYCTRAATPSSRYYCYLNGSVFIGLMIMSNKFSSHFFNQLCNGVINDTKLYGYCIKEIVHYTMAGIGINSIPLVINYCSKVDVSYTNLCYKYINDVLLERMDKKTQKNACMIFPSQYRSLCTIEPTY